MDRAEVTRRRLKVASIVLAVAAVGVGICELILHDGHVAALRTDICRTKGTTATVFAAAFLVTTWRWVRTKPTEKSYITVKDLRGR